MNTPGFSGRSDIPRFAISPWPRSKTPCPILTALEERYQETFGASLTIKRLGEAIFTPRLPDKGAHMQYDLNVAASSYLKDDILLMQRLSRGRDGL